jgi:xanthine/CO dehydrogenase XdhC/CoxF family maturation factor
LWEARALVAAAARLRASAEPYLLATVVRVIGSSYRRPGARLVATEAGRVAGSVSGGCLEGDLLRTGWWRTRDGPVVARYDASDPDEPGAALGCGGVVDLLLERGVRGDEAGDPLGVVAGVLAGERRAVMATVFDSTIAGLPIGTRWTVDRARHGALAEQVLADAAAIVRTTSRRYRDDAGELEVLLEPVLPPPHLFVLGAGLDAVPVVEQARGLGWRVTVCDSLGRVTMRERFAAADDVMGASLDEVHGRVAACERAVAVVMGHDERRDAEAVAMLLRSDARYIGVLGPRHRTERFLPAVAAVDPRVHAPVGLHLGAETPEEIALSIIAENLAVLRDATAEPLRRRALIHTP